MASGVKECVRVPGKRNRCSTTLRSVENKAATSTHSILLAMTTFFDDRRIRQILRESESVLVTGLFANPHSRLPSD
jgi:hypothetical protein